MNTRDDQAAPPAALVLRGTLIAITLSGCAGGWLLGLGTSSRDFGAEPLLRSIMVLSFWSASVLGSLLLALGMALSPRWRRRATGVVAAIGITPLVILLLC